MKHCCEHKVSEDEAKKLLTANGLNRTKLKVGILRIIAEGPTPLSATEIFQKLDDKCDISTVFRTVGQFKEKGLIRELNLGEDFFRYELIGLGKGTKSSHHHHHVRCRDCGEIKLIEKCDIGVFEKFISKLGYQEMEHYLEFTGICSINGIKYA
jgi:Fur family ferric uptake transcriptional regulator